MLCNHYNNFDISVIDTSSVQPPYPPGNPPPSNHVPQPNPALSHPNVYPTSMSK